jgi:Trk K+ transport system NAD-binding subunit
MHAPAAFYGKSLEQLALRTKYRVNLVAIRRREPSQDGDRENGIATTYVPHGGYQIHAEDRLLLLGTDAALNNLPK